MSSKKESFFWTSYSDLMTSLFFVMLVLFVLSVILFRGSHRKLEEQYIETKADKERLESILRSTKDLAKEGGYFTYREEYKKYVLKVPVYFPINKSSLYDMEADQNRLYSAGMEIKQFLEDHKANDYLLIIEGQASRDSKEMSLSNYELSFKRALTLMQFWKEVSRIDFGTNCEIQIAGSGDGRYNFGYTGPGDASDPRFWFYYNDLMREKDEEKNQRFVIHLIPKNIIPE